MKKIIKTILFIILFIPIIIFGKEKELNMYLFYGDGCPHCAALEVFLDDYLKDKDYIKLYKYEVWYNQENMQKYTDVNNLLNTKASGIPYLVIGDNAIVGYNESSTPERIKSTINYYIETNFKDDVGIYLGVVNDEGKEKITESFKYDEITIPIIGKKKTNEVPIILSTILIGLVDGFNPCAMWILIFLISMLLGMNNNKRKWILGITFLLSSAVVYFLFLISWLNLAVFLNKIEYIRLGISFVAIMFGFYSVVKFVTSKQDDGCEVVDSKNRKRIILSIKKIVKEKSFILALLGIVLLAVSVNVIELLCSLGLPVMYSEILAVNNVSNTSKVLYSLIYVFFFLIDDIIVFIIAMKTLEIKVISNKFGKYSHLIGGIIMIIIGTLMMLKPDWLMFNF